MGAHWQVGILTFTLASAALPGAAQPGQLAPARADALFERWTHTTPGCAAAAAVDGQQVFSNAYGLAELEHNVRNTPETIFESGSVSKQFTAASVLLLVRGGKLSLDDPVRRHVPELHDFGPALTIRHLVHHTSGLRDWGSVEGIAGWPRTTRAYTHAHVLDRLGRQRALNFPTGTRWSYTNSGYNLLAIIVSRVSGMSFADFTAERIFMPLGMTSTSWRDDHTRVVRRRAVAYSDEADGFHIDMPFENVHGNGGLLTTVGDLLKWNANFAAPKVGDAAFVADLQRVGTFTDGRAHDYAFGLRVGTYKGVRQVDHSGSTAGYRAHLAHYPDQKVAVAVLCNVSTASATEYARKVAELYLGDRLKPKALNASHTLTGDEIRRVSGMYRDTARGTALTIAHDGKVLRAGPTTEMRRGQERIAEQPALVPASASRFSTSDGETWELDARGGLRITDQFGTVSVLARVEDAKPAAAGLRALEGTYANQEAETRFVAVLDGDRLVLRQRPDRTIPLTPLYADAFSAGPLGTIVFRRDGSGRVIELSVVQERVWDLRFQRESEATTSSHPRP